MGTVDGVGENRLGIILMEIRDMTRIILSELHDMTKNQRKLRMFDMKSNEQLQNKLINLKAESTDLKEKLTEIEKAKGALKILSGINFHFDSFDGDISVLEDKLEYWDDLLSQKLEANKEAMDSIIVKLHSAISKVLCLSDETKCN